MLLLLVMLAMVVVVVLLRWIFWLCSRELCETPQLKQLLSSLPKQQAWKAMRTPMKTSPLHFCPCVACIFEQVL